MKFNERQKKGFARSLDNLSVASLIGSVVGISGRTVMSLWEIAMLLIAVVFCTIAAAAWRGD